VSISNYIQSLLPSFEASRVKDNLTNLSQELDQYTVPSFKTMAETFPENWKWKNADVEKINKTIVSGYRNKVPMRNANSLEIIQAVLVNMQTTLPMVQLQVSKVFGNEIAAAGLSFNKATLLQYAEAAEFMINYSRVYYNYLSAVELAALEGDRSIPEGVGPDDLMYLMAKRHTFTIALNIMAITVKDVRTDLKDIPDALVSTSSEEDMKLVVGANKIDPFGFASLPFPISLVYHAGLAIADWQMDRYDRAQVEARVLEYRSLLLKQQIETGNGDAAVESRLRDEEARLKVMKRKIARLEEKYEL